MSKSLDGRQSNPISTDPAGLESVDAGVPPGRARVHASFALPERPKRSVAAAIVSALMHLLVILLAIRLTQAVVEVKDTPAGNAIMQFMGGGGGGGGNGGVAFTALTKPPPPPPPVVPPEEPVVLPKIETVPDKIPVVEPPAAKAADTTHAASSAASNAGTGGGSGGGQGTGTGTGTGSGIGPGSGSGTGGGNGGGRGGFPPESHFLVIPLSNTPKNLRGTSVDVKFWVAADGRVTNIEVTPAIKDRDYSKRFDETMRSYRFTPARDEAGKAVAGVIVMSVTF